MTNKSDLFKVLVLLALPLSAGYALAGDAIDSAQSAAINADRSFDGTARTRGNIAPEAENRAADVRAAAPAAPKPTLAEKAGEFLKENKTTIIFTAVGAYLGFALMGGLMGALTGGIFFILILMMAGRL